MAQHLLIGQRGKIIMSSSRISENAMILVIVAIVECLLSDIRSLREHVIARVEYLDEAIADAPRPSKISQMRWHG
jgi:hypothetical protein